MDHQVTDDQDQEYIWESNYVIGKEIRQLMKIINENKLNEQVGYKFTVAVRHALLLILREKML